MKSKDLVRRSSLHVRFIPIAIISLALCAQLAAQDLELGEYYKHKARIQNTVGWVLVVGGVVLVVAGAAMAATSVTVNALTGQPDNKPAGGGAAIAGVICMVGSIPLFVISANNKAKARVAFTSSSIQRPGSFGVAKITQPCLKLTIQL